MGGTGSGGSNKKPTAIHVLAGTFRPSRHAKRTLADVPAAALGLVGAPPRWLSPEAKTLWRQVRPQLEHYGILTALDRALFIALCETWALWRRDQESSALKNLLTLAQMYGLTPLARRRLGISEDAAVKEIDPMEAILSKGS